MEPLRLTAAATHVKASSPLEEPATPRQTEVVAVSPSMLQERWLPLAPTKCNSVVTSEEVAVVDLVPAAQQPSDEAKDEPVDESDIHPLLRTSVQAAAEIKEIGPTQVDTKPNIILETASPDVDPEPLPTSSQVETLPSLGNDAQSADKEEAKEAASNTSTADTSTSHPEILSTDVLDLESSTESDVHPVLESNAQFITETCDLDTSIISTTATTAQDYDIVSPLEPTSDTTHQPSTIITPETQAKPDMLDVVNSSKTAVNYTTLSTDDTTAATAVPSLPQTITTTTTTTTERPATPADSLYQVPTTSTSTTTAPGVFTTTAAAATLPPPHTAYTSSIPSPPPTGVGESLPVTTGPLTTVASISSSVVADEQAEEVKTYTMREVAKHSSARDCWLVIDGDVYDCTEFAARHPGGAKSMSSFTCSLIHTWPILLRLFFVCRYTFEYGSFPVSGMSSGMASLQLKTISS